MIWCIARSCAYGDDTPTWELVGPDGVPTVIAANPRLRASNGKVVHDWCLVAHGIMVKSTIEISGDLASGRHQPRKLRAFLDATARAIRR